MSVWDRDETKQLVELNFGKTQAELAYQSMCSTIDRQQYALYHYRSVKKLFDDCVGKFNSPMSFVELSFDGSEDSEELNQRIWEIGAHVTACVQSLHAMGDIFAHAIYYALGYTLKPTKKGEQKLYLSDVKDELRKLEDYRSLAQELDLFTSGDDYAYLTALANHCKHQSLVRSVLWVDLIGGKLDPYTLEFQGFTSNKKSHPRCPVLPFLQREFDRQSQQTFEIGAVLNSILKARSPNANVISE